MAMMGVGADFPRAGKVYFRLTHRKMDTSPDAEPAPSDFVTYRLLIE